MVEMKKRAILQSYGKALNYQGQFHDNVMVLDMDEGIESYQRHKGHYTISILEMTYTGHVVEVVKRCARSRNSCIC